MLTYSHYLDKLRKYVAFRTVSLPGHQEPDQIGLCINFILELMNEAGMKTQVWEAEGLNPVIFAEYVFDEELPTVLVYGHYDVVAVNTEEWTITSPFELKEQDGYLYARGSTDNKGQNLMHLLTVIDLIKDGNLAFNIKFFIEGNEETGSQGIDKLILAKQKELSAKYFLVSDGEMVGKIPVIETSLRGLVNIRAKVSTSSKNLHSGLSGSAVYNSAVVASGLISSLFDHDGKVVVPLFYRGIPEALIESSQTNNRRLSEAVNLLDVFGVQQLKQTSGFDPFTLNGLTPTIEVMGIASGSAHNGFKHIIPGSTEFGLNIRLVGSQDPNEVANLVMRFIRSKMPNYATVEMEVYAQHGAINIDLGAEIKLHLLQLLNQTYQIEAGYHYVGGGIPVVEYFINAGIQPLLIPLANNTCNMHDVHENIGVENVEKGLAFSHSFFSTPLPVILSC
ncbi:MAG: M20/M25/M40 family metallo-hydrolase [Candidatus Pacebacteria bacterium]|nr:M20/M25/M40 family metallo-hydrolase [Candidatus Paceibacterota bacterium]